MTLTEQMLQYLRLLRLIAHESRLAYLVGRPRHSDLHLHRIVEYRRRQLLYLRRHRRREHQRLTLLGKLPYDLHYIVVETHVEHTVGLVEDKERHLRQIHITHAQMSEQTPRSGYHHIGAHLETALLTGKLLAVSAAVYGHTRYRQKIRKTLHLAVDLLRKLTRGSHHYAVYGIGRIIALRQTADHRQQISRRLACAGLRHSQQIAPFERYRYCLLLYWGALAEIHVIERVEHFITEVKLFKSHCGYRLLLRFFDSPTKLRIFYRTLPLAPPKITAHYASPPQ